MKRTETLFDIFWRLRNEEYPYGLPVHRGARLCVEFHLEQEAVREYIKQRQYDYARMDRPPKVESRYDRKDDWYRI